MITLDAPIARFGRFSIFHAPDGGATLIGAGFIKTYRRMDSARPRPGAPRRCRGLMRATARPS